MAIAPIQPTQNTSKKTVRKVLTAAAATGTILYLAKKGKLNPTEGGNKYVEGLKAALKKPADYINGKIAEGVDKLQKNEKIGKKMTEAQKIVSEKIEQAKANPDVKSAMNFVRVKKAQVVSAVRNAVDAARNFVEKEINPEKFGEAVKDAAEKL